MERLGGFCFVLFFQFKLSAVSQSKLLILWSEFEALDKQLRIGAETKNSAFASSLDFSFISGLITESLVSIFSHL